MDGNIPSNTVMIKENKRDFTSLDVWKKCRELKLKVYEQVLRLLPVEEKYNLNDQIRRAAVSITANIAEGYGRFNYQESIQYYRISRGSIYELKDHLITCMDLKYISAELFQTIEVEMEEVSKLLNGYIRYIKGKKNE